MQWKSESQSEHTENWKYMKHFSKFMHSKQMGKKVYICRIDKICLPECEMSPNGEPMLRSVHHRIELKFEIREVMHCFHLERFCVRVYV